VKLIQAIMNSDDTDFLILIATKDRHSKLDRLLISILSSSRKPEQIIIVNSGISIDFVVNKYLGKLNIEVITSIIADQSVQKRKGIEYIGSRKAWVLFLDDDVIIHDDTIQKLLDNYLNNENYNDFAGFGLSIQNRKVRYLNLILRLVLYLFTLYSFTPGKITKSGHPQSYLESKINREVDWLNGISVWRSEILGQYNSMPFALKYSAYEDVIFSHKVHRKFKLMFLVDIEVTNQTTEGNSPLSSEQFLSGSYARYFFVSSNKEFSKVLLIFAQIFRSFDYVIRSNNKLNHMKRFNLAIRTLIQLLLLTIKVKKLNYENYVHNLSSTEY